MRLLEEVEDMLGLFDSAAGPDGDQLNDEQEAVRDTLCWVLGNCDAGAVEAWLPEDEGEDDD